MWDSRCLLTDGRTGAAECVAGGQGKPRGAGRAAKALSQEGTLTESPWGLISAIKPASLHQGRGKPEKKHIKQVNASFRLAAALCRGTGPFPGAEPWRGLPGPSAQPSEQPRHRGVVLTQGTMPHPPVCRRAALPEAFAAPCSCPGEEPAATGPQLRSPEVRRAARSIWGRGDRTVALGGLPSGGAGLPAWPGRWGPPGSQEQPCPFLGLTPCERSHPLCPGPPGPATNLPGAVPAQQPVAVQNSWEHPWCENLLHPDTA